MRIKSMAATALACLAVVAMAACGPTKTPKGGGQTSVAAPASSAAAATVKDIPAGNCTLYTKAQAVTLLGAVNSNNKALEIKTDGGTKIDVCSYLNLKGLTALEGISYAVVRFDSAATAFTEAQKVQTEMLGDAAEHNWPVQSLTTPAPGAGQVLGGYGTKTEQGVTTTIAVVGTNVGPYLVVALGGSTENSENAKAFALKVFQSLSDSVG